MDNRATSRADPGVRGDLFLCVCLWLFMEVMGCSDQTSFDPSTPPQLAPLYARKCCAQRHLLSELDNETPQTFGQDGLLGCAVTWTQIEMPSFFHTCLHFRASCCAFMMLIFLELSFQGKVYRQRIQHSHVAHTASAPCVRASFGWIYMCFTEMHVYVLTWQSSLCILLASVFTSVRCLLCYIQRFASLDLKLSAVVELIQGNIC